MCTSMATPPRLNAVASSPAVGNTDRLDRPFPGSDDRLLLINPVWPVHQWRKPVTYWHQSLTNIAFRDLGEDSGIWNTAGLRIEGGGGTQRGDDLE